MPAGVPLSALLALLATPRRAVAGAVRTQQSPAEALRAAGAVASTAPNGTEVQVGGAPHMVHHLEVSRPTLAPHRWENYHPVKSLPERIEEYYGPTPQPDRDCTRRPEGGDCDCKELISSCHQEAYECDLSLRQLAKDEPRALRGNYLSHMSHPLLNTLSLGAKLRRQRGQQQPPPKEAKCGACVRRLVDQRANPAGGSDWSFTQRAKSAASQKQYPPSEYGWRIDQEQPFYKGQNWDEVEGNLMMLGACSQQEIEGLEECLTYFWGCEQNRVKLYGKINALDSETEWIDSNPGTRPGIFSGL